MIVIWLKCILYVVLKYGENKTSGDGFSLKMGVCFLEVVTNNTKTVLIYYAFLFPSLLSLPIHLFVPLFCHC